ncbi:hypothetical protein ACW7GZ_14795 [Luteimonas sp. A537]
MKRFLSLIVLSLATSPVLALDPLDQGVFALVSNKGTVTNKVARLSLVEGQWHVEDRRSDGTWQDVTCGRDCALRVSTSAEVKEFTKDTYLVDTTLACVHNMAFAFCSDASVTYHMLAFSEGQVIPLSWVRLKTDPLPPADAP